MRGALLVLLLAAACGGDDEPPHPPISVSFTLDESTCATCASVDECQLHCPGRIGFFLVDEDGDVLDQRCEAIEGTVDQTLRAMPDLLAGVSPFAIAEGSRFALQVVVYPGLDCPQAIRDGDGNWFAPGVTPYYAGASAVVTLDDALTSVEVTVECVSEVLTCDLDEVTFEAWVTDLDTLQQEFDVSVFPSIRVNAAILQPTSATPPAYNLVPDAELDRVVDEENPENAIYRATGLFTFDNDCYGTLVSRIGGGLNAAVGSCEGSELGSLVLSTSFLIDAPVVDAVLDALDLDTLPDEGIVVGRITDGATNPRIGTVRALDTETEMTVTYLEESTPGEFVAAASGSWFVITDMKVGADERPCCDYLELLNDKGEPVGQTFSVLGLVRGVIMGIVIY